MVKSWATEAKNCLRPSFFSEHYCCLTLRAMTIKTNKKLDYQQLEHQTKRLTNYEIYVKSK